MAAGPGEAGVAGGGGRIAPPLHRLVRDRLVAPLAASRTGLVHAGGGFGKSVLAEQVAERLGIATVRLALRPADDDPAMLTARLGLAIAAARLSDLAAAVEGRTEPARALGALCDALDEADEAVLVVLDDAHQLKRLAGDVVEPLLHRIRAPHHLLVLGRDLGPSASSGTEGSVLSLSAADLAFNVEEIERLVRRAADLELSDEQLETVWRSTAGWPAVVVLWAQRLAVTGQPEAEIERLAEKRAGLGALVDDLLAALPAEAAHAASQMAHLSLLSDRLAGAVFDDPDLLARLAAAGLGFVAAEPGWVRLADPIAERLAEREALDPATARRAAAVYASAGEHLAALTALLDGDCPEDAAQALGRLPVDRLARVGPAAVRAVASRLPRPTRDRSPEAMLQVARACDADGCWNERAAALSTAMQAAQSGGDESLVRAIAAEQAYDALRQGDLRRAAELADRLLAEASWAESGVRARALVCQGRIGGLTAADDEDLRRALCLLEEAAEAARACGDAPWTASVLLRLAEDGYRELCRYRQAIDTIDEAINLDAGAARVRALALVSKADTLVEIGRTAEAEAAFAAANTLARRLGDSRLLAYVSWGEMLLAAALGDAPRMRASAALCEAHRGDWFDGFSGVGFLTDAADAFDRLGLHEAASGYLERARPRRSQDERQFDLAAARIAARSGEAVHGLGLLSAALAMPGLTPRRRWRLRLLEAWAASRADQPGAAAMAAAVFEMCTALGHPDLPFVAEPTVAEALLPLAVSEGSPAATALAAGRVVRRVRVLGVFRVQVAGRNVPIPPGRPTLAVLALALFDAGLPADQLIELLWRDAAPAAGRERLRNVLSRLRRAAGDLVEREHDLVRLAGDVEVDCRSFAEEASAALRLVSEYPGRAAALARSAYGRYAGPLVPELAYADWAVAPRERLRSLFLSMLDLLAGDAEAHGQIDEAVRLLRQAIEVEPYDEDRYLRAARMLRSQGRVGSARAVLAEGRAALAELGLGQGSLTFDRL